MKLHRNAKTCPQSRALMARRVLEEGWSLTRVAAAAGVSEPTARKWVRRARTGEPLEDRSSTPKRIPGRTPERVVKAIETLRRVRLTAAEIAEVLQLCLSTVSLWLKRIGLGRRSRLDPPEPPNRYERRRAGELVHVDIKRLGRIGPPGKRMLTRGPGVHPRGFGWEAVHVCVDDASRLAYVEVLPDEHGETAARFLRRAALWFKGQGVVLERVMSDNGACYRSHAHARACRELGLRHLRTRPYRPRTNGKAERFIQTLQNEWAYARLYSNSDERTAALLTWLNHYNLRRPHGSLGHRPPAARLSELMEQRA